jgi:hypothetical protein
VTVTMSTDSRIGSCSTQSVSCWRCLSPAFCVLSVRSMKSLATVTGWGEISYFSIFENPYRLFKFHYNLTRITSTLHENLCTFYIISRSILLRITNVSDKSRREYKNTFYVQYHFSENRTLYEITWKNRAGQATDDIVYAPSMLIT